MFNQNKNLVYFEKQGQDMLCGLHCINVLLQGPMFDEVQLAAIAIQLDQEEQALLDEETRQALG